MHLQDYFFTMLLYASWVIFLALANLTFDSASASPVGAVPESVKSHEEPKNDMPGKNETQDEDWIDKWEPPKRLVEWFPYLIIGEDYDGAEVFICKYGRWNFRKLVSEGTKEETKLVGKYLNYVSTLFIRAGKSNNDDGAVIIYDWDDFTLANYADPKALRLTLNAFSKLVHTFPYLKRGFSINTNFAAQAFLNIAKPFMGNYLDKIEIFGTKREKWIPKLLAQMPAGILPPEYGGKRRDKH